MAEDNLISDVRGSKGWVHAHTDGFARLLEHLARVEHDFLERTGEYAGVPRARPEDMIRAIESASDEPGRDLLEDARERRSA